MDNCPETRNRPAGDPSKSLSQTPGRLRPRKYTVALKKCMESAGKLKGAKFSTDLRKIEEAALRSHNVRERLSHVSVTHRAALLKSPTVPFRAASEVSITSRHIFLQKTVAKNTR